MKKDLSNPRASPRGGGAATQGGRPARPRGAPGKIVTCTELTILFLFNRKNNPFTRAARAQRAQRNLHGTSLSSSPTALGPWQLHIRVPVQIVVALDGDHCQIRGGHVLPMLIHMVNDMRLELRSTANPIWERQQPPTIVPVALKQGDTHNTMIRGVYCLVLLLQEHAEVPVVLIIIQVLRFQLALVAIQPAHFLLS